ncbi:hypothetical protein Tco_0767995 [Tanacetum coccineum]
MPITTTVFATTTLENTPFAYHASILTNPNPTNSPTFVEASYEILESLLREQRRQIRNEDLRTKLEYFSKDYDEEREMEPMPEPRREATLTLRLRSPRVRRQRERVVGFEDAPNREGNRRGRNVEGIRPSEIKAREGHQPSTNIGGNLPPNSTLLSHHAQPFIPSSLHIPTGLVPTPVNPYSQPHMNLVHVQALNILFHTQMGNPLAGGAFTYQGGYTFYAQPMYAPPNMPAYPNPAEPFADSAGFVTPFVRWIEDYPLPDGLKMPSYIGSYNGKGDPDNFLHLFEGAIRIYTDDTLQILGLHEEQRISGFIHGLRTRSLVEHLSTDLPSTYKGLMEKTYTWVEAREVATNGVLNNRRDDPERSNKFSWGNNIGPKDRGRFSPYKGKNHKLLSNLVKSPRHILATGKVAKTFKQAPWLPRANWSKDRTRYCHLHEDYGNETNQCRELRH